MCGWVDPTEVSGVMRTKFPASNSDGFRCCEGQVSADGDVDGDADADADAYVETLQTIVVKPPWKDNLAYAFQQDSVPSHKALKTQDWMDGQEFSSSSCHTKLIPAS
ncbi:hypothetical protein ACTXT7_004446 [Hymenolepis weldensis]